MSNETDTNPEDAARDDKPKLKVTDRRMFDTDGNPRQPDMDPDESSSETVAPEPPRVLEDADTAPAQEETLAPPDVEPDSPHTADEQATSEAAPENAAAPAGGYADLPRGFAAFVESQYLEALIFLGAVPHPQTGETVEDAEFARYKIDLLAMIQEKTAGNLTDEEAKLIEDVLYQLRMLFVQKTGPVAT